MFEYSCRYRVNEDSGLLSRIDIELKSGKINDFEINDDLLKLRSRSKEDLKESAERILGLYLDDFDKVVKG
jgi:hypothetical protein